MAKSKYSAERKIAIVEKYLSGEGSYESLSNAYGIDSKTLRAWAAKIKAQGEIGFQERNGNRHYSKEFKLKCVKIVLRGEQSVRDVVAKHNISDEYVLRSWILKYNANMALKNTN